MTAKKKILLISQVYSPDPAAVGMQMADAALELAERGYDVCVLTADRGYDDPSQKYPSRETAAGVDIIRLPLSSFGKSSIVTRLVSGLFFVAQACVRGAFLDRVDGILVTTAPPMCSMAALFIGGLRRAPIAYWVMDLNPDQMVVLGKLSATSPAVRAFDVLNRLILRKAKLIVALDEFMGQRLEQKHSIQDKLEILPPWPHDNYLTTIPHEENPFRKEHGLQGKFVVMYSGNHGPSSPVTTCLEAAEVLKHREDIVFLFVGGGVGKQEVERAIARGASNVRSLPYQPIDSIKYSLSAADVHLVTVGDSIVGVVHPSKIYGAMSIGRPILLTAPEKCHAAPLVVPNGVGEHLKNGDVAGTAAAIERLAGLSPEERERMGKRAREIISRGFSRQILRTRFADLLTRRLGLEDDQ